MSVVTYDNVVLPFASLSQFRQEAVYDDSNTDWYLTRYIVDCSAVINYNYLPLIAPDLVGVTQNPAYIMAIVRNRLLKPRKVLSVQINGTELIPQNGLTGTVDAKNGPIPQHCNVTQLTEVSFLISFSIIAHYWEMSTSGITLVAGGGTSNAVLYNRWSESIDIDHLNYTKRVREGKFAIRSDNASGAVADMCIRQMAVVGVPTDFTRESASYRITPDGLTVVYRVVDKENFKMPPSPAYEATGTYSESSQFPHAKRDCEVSLTLKGAKNVVQSEMLQTAFNVAMTKLKINGAAVVFGGGPINAKGRGILTSTNVSVQMWENEVSVRLKAWKSNLVRGIGVPIGGGRNRFGGILEYDWVNMTTTPGSEQGERPQPLRYPVKGTADLILQAAAYYDPSLSNQQVDQVTGRLNNGVQPGQAGLTPEA